MSNKEYDPQSKETLNREYFLQLSQNPARLFNFFYESQDSLGWIKKHDYDRVTKLNKNIMEIKAYSILTGLGSAAILNHYVIPYVIRPKVFKFGIFFKIFVYYIGGMLGKVIGEDLYAEPLYDELKDIHVDYIFNYSDSED